MLKIMAIYLYFLHTFWCCRFYLTSIVNIFKQNSLKNVADGEKPKTTGKF
jgi:hypothetical protein